MRDFLFFITPIYTKYIGSWDNPNVCLNYITFDLFGQDCIIVIA
jgi:hypothetical protein